MKPKRLAELIERARQGEVYASGILTGELERLQKEIDRLQVPLPEDLEKRLKRLEGECFAETTVHEEYIEIVQALQAQNNTLQAELQKERGAVRSLASRVADLEWGCEPDSEEQP